ncbi:hypothetical protein TSOC_004971 [Tetrabaena socialis]|uniref:Uncharacterized protein n=1 Tax=Tetrabaena socialis TaxID=47790 RepID=A0A2J8A7C8_9CHLO|nr:hypothetical protein TSOC_004971 [Tetrabaena socialis]|eukprot:PNH08446.1 hypothetical protein TSOC_004971 [Tetrabaena socialis]
MISRRHRSEFVNVDALIDARGEPLDEREQDSVIGEFVALSVEQHRTWRSVIGWGVLCAALFFAFAAWSQHVEPYGVRYTGELRSATRPHAVTAALGLQAVSLLAAAAALLANLPQRLPPDATLPSSSPPALAAPWQRAALWGGVLGAAAGAAYWGAALHGSRLELLWLPAGPLVACLLAVYVTRMLADTGREIQRLQAYRYRYKKV